MTTAALLTLVTGCTVFRDRFVDGGPPPAPPPAVPPPVIDVLFVVDLSPNAANLAALYDGVASGLLRELSDRAQVRRVGMIPLTRRVGTAVPLVGEGGVFADVVRRYSVGEGAPFLTSASSREHANLLDFGAVAHEAPFYAGPGRQPPLEPEPDGWPDSRLDAGPEAQPDAGAGSGPDAGGFDSGVDLGTDSGRSPSDAGAGGVFTDAGPRPASPLPGAAFFPPAEDGFLVVTLSGRSPICDGDCESEARAAAAALATTGDTGLAAWLALAGPSGHPPPRIGHLAITPPEVPDHAALARYCGDQPNFPSAALDFLSPADVYWSTVSRELEERGGRARDVDLCVAASARAGSILPELAGWVTGIAR